MAMKKNKNSKPHANYKSQVLMEAKFRKENENARIAGKEYGILAMGLIALMATIAHSEVSEIQKYMIDASEVLSREVYIALPDLISLVNEKMGSSVTTDQIVEADSSFSKFF